MRRAVRQTDGGKGLGRIERVFDQMRSENRALVDGAAAAEFRLVHYEHVTREATLNLEDYETRAKRIRETVEQAARNVRANHFRR